MITGIHHVSIIVASEASIGFYAKLGFQEYRRIERGKDTVILMSGYGIGLDLFLDSSHPARNIEPLGPRYFSLKVDRIESTVEELGLAHGPIKQNWFGDRYCFVTDPDGNRVQLHE